LRLAIVVIHIGSGEFVVLIKKDVDFFSDIKQNKSQKVVTKIIITFI